MAHYVHPGACPAMPWEAALAYTRPVHLDEEACLARLAHEWELPLAAEMAARLLSFARRLMEWNARINLTGAASVAEVVGEHLVDSFAMARMVPAGSSVIEVGAGGGLPGLPFRILRPDVRLTLVEPRAKKVAFLRTATREFGLVGTEVLRTRSDALDPGRFDVSASRATFTPEEWLTLGLRLVRPGGLVLVFAGNAWTPGISSVSTASAVSYKTAAGRSRWLGAFCST